MKLFIPKTLILSLLFTLIACKKEDVKPEEIEANNDHVSVLKENSGWSTYAYSNDAFLGSPLFSHITTIPSDFKVHLGTIDQNRPAFFSSWRYNSQDVFPRPYQAKMLYESDKSMIAVPIPYSMATEQDLGKENRGLSGGIPYNLSNKLSQSFTYINRFFVHDGEAYASSDSWRKVFNAWRSSYNVKSIVDNSGNRYGWFTAAHKSKFPASIDFSGNPLYKEVLFSDVGTVDLIKSGADLKIMSVGKFHDSKADGTTNHRACLLEKNWNTLTDSIDHVYPLPFHQDVHEKQILTKTFCIDQNMLSTIWIPELKKLLIAFGNRTNGMNYIATYESAAYIDEVVKTQNSYFCIFTDESGQRNAIKVSTNGTITNYTNIPSGDYSHYKGDLVVGVYSVNGINGNSTSIYRITPSGTELMGKEGLLKQASEVTLASDGNNLFAAVKNCLSPIYSGGAGQFCGYEIIKFN